MPAYFVTGTDTGVGKTLVSAALLVAARRRGLSTAALKPAETGCASTEGGDLLAADAALLAAAAGTSGSSQRSCLYRYTTPAAPAVAAREENRPVSIDAISEAVAALRADAPDLLIVEGAGGLLVPFTDQHTAADLAHRLDLPLLLVARPGLGTINHCALTVECARHRNLRLRGIVLSHAAPIATDPTVDTNVAEIERLTGAPVLGRLPHLPATDLRTLAEAAERYLPLDELLTI